ncbi:response regulator transcription factor [Thalassomonas haliotis]|uniref:Response regulator transcription factor n=1 Tax=Thalassomonas haliotis TaxID=485448 RepID=A0ABY7VIZ5_9GAMM|nr:response regulator transcription factor [Thalassomonas haliotis]WDE13699.1 response regulator transcription factor [Thalassomonas haliotis]
MSEKKQILVVEDDQDLALLVSEYLNAQGFVTNIIDNGLDAVDQIINEQPALVILDLNLPGRDGFSICRAVRNQYPGPLLMLTASDEAIDQVVGLELGADDYVKKPIEPRILLARIRALLRRIEEIEYKNAQQKNTDNDPPITEQNNTTGEAAASTQDMLTAGDIHIHVANRIVYFQEKELHLSTPEYELLLILAQHAGEIVSRNFLFEQIKGYEYDGVSRFIDIIISQLRHKLSDEAAAIIKTIRGKGYLLIR